MIMRQSPTTPVPAHHLPRRSCRLLSRNTIVLALALTASTVTLAACGSSSSSTSSTSTTKAATATSSSAAVQTSNSPFGAILVDNKGVTLYTLVNGNKPVGCYSPCTTVWPPLFLPSGATTPTGGPGVTNLGTTKSKEITYKGFPLFHYSGDKSPGQINGNNINSFGGVWHVIVNGTTPGT
jgi:predicted lipoprotein with Yx(FWY)xxD motif